MKLNVYFPGLYTGQTERAIEKSVRKEGFDPLRIVDGPGRAYRKHSHPETKLLAFLEGSMTLVVGGFVYECKPGDKVIIPGNVVHEANVGESGCVFLWSEKMM